MVLTHIPNGIPLSSGQTPEPLRKIVMRKRNTIKIVAFLLSMLPLYTFANINDKPSPKNKKHSKTGSKKVSQKAIQPQKTPRETEKKVIKTYKPKIVHAPPFGALENEPLKISIRIIENLQAHSIRLHYRPIETLRYTVIAFVRQKGDLYTAVIPEEIVTLPGVEYYIDAKPKGEKSKGITLYTSKRFPKQVHIRIPAKESKLLNKLDRHNGTRSTVGMSLDINTFGSYEALGRTQNTGQPLRMDYYYQLEVWYTYRFLRLFYNATIGYGHLRGDLPLDKRFWNLAQPADPNSPVLAMGMDYGFGKFYTEFHKYFGVEWKVLIGGSHEGFGFGGGATLRVGNIVESHIDLGFELISGLGYQFFAELAWGGIQNLTIAFRAEGSNMPLNQDIGLATKLYLIGLWKISPHFHTFLHLGFGKRQAVSTGSVVGKFGIMTNF